MKWFDRWFYRQAKKAWANKNRFEEEEAVQMKERASIKMAGLQIGTAMVEKGAPEGDGTIRFELSSAVGGKILTVRRHDPHRDNFNQQTYVIPSGEDIGERVAKIINLEQFR